MNALNTSLDVEAAHEVQTSSQKSSLLASPATSGAAPRLADWLRLAAAPTFAVMALLTGTSGGGLPDMLCAATREGPLLDGMAAMYLLMSVFHLPPWLKLISAQRSGTAP